MFLPLWRNAPTRRKSAFGQLSFRHIVYQLKYEKSKMYMELKNILIL